ncbi:magnesium/cobalt transporter CorA [Marinitoga aeolica]|uniref:Magnesium transport protein CorA n=1 Tax=Marinitoga aeolica TaxID=2809031 RepID=A0ABY8PPJ9_9BACT|nr:magnesium/cobalt transporter CorA [Marinitoga aeolica]WGS64563.1 magnesium/cobalt transporter CorA [Marinitoga aeolica]
MSKKKKYTKKFGTPPATLIYTGKFYGDFEIEVSDYDKDEYNEIHTKNIEDCFLKKEEKKTRWINLIGIHDTDSVKKLCDRYNIDPLVIEDILNIHQHPKIEVFEEYIFIVLKMLSYNEITSSIEIEQVSIILGEDYIITFQEKKGDVFDFVRKRIRANEGLIRKKKNDYLLFSLMDSIIDFYFARLEEIEEKLNIIEENLLIKSSPEKEKEIYYIKKNLNIMIKSILHIKDVIALIVNDKPKLIKDSFKYFKDLYDHTIQITDISETLINSANDLFDFYLYMVNNKMNSIMKILTIISTIFIPLTLITGIYGMNFKYMPELQSKYGYPIVLMVMAIISAIMLYIFKKKKWM